MAAETGAESRVAQASAQRDNAIELRQVDVVFHGPFAVAVLCHGDSELWRRGSALASALAESEERHDGFDPSEQRDTTSANTASAFQDERVQCRNADGSSSSSSHPTLATLSRSNSTCASSSFSIRDPQIEARLTACLEGRVLP